MPLASDRGNGLAEMEDQGRARAPETSHCGTDRFGHLADEISGRGFGRDLRIHGELAVARLRTVYDPLQASLLLPAKAPCRFTEISYLAD